MIEQIDRGLVVDSSFRSRLDLIADIRASGMVREIIEASSINDGIDRLKNSSLHACFVGASLTEQRAIDFIRTGTTVTRSKDCAFVAVTSDDTARGQALVAAGAHATLQKPYTPESFSSIVERAVSVARERAREQFEGATADIRKETARHSDRFLSELLADASSGISQISDYISQGRLALTKDGKPSLATRDAIRLVLNGAMPSTSTPSQIGTFDHHFVSMVVDWFADRVDTDQKSATENLRKKLLGFKGLQQT